MTDVDSRQNQGGSGKKWRRKRRRRRGGGGGGGGSGGGSGGGGGGKQGPAVMPEIDDPTEEAITTRSSSVVTAVPCSSRHATIRLPAPSKAADGSVWLPTADKLTLRGAPEETPLASKNCAKTSKPF